MPEQAEPSPAHRRLGRPIIVFLILLTALAAGGMYAATAIVVRVDNVILPGVEVVAPEPVRRVLPGLVSTPAAGSPGATPVHLLILGVDRRPHHDQAVDGPPNADSIHYLSVDPLTRTGTMLTFPRDLYLDMPSPQKEGERWEARINSSYRLGEEYKYPGGGAALAVRTVEEAFHLPVDYYVVVDWVAFADVVDAMGGIDLNAPEELRDVETFNPRNGHTFFVNIPSGQIHLDGVWALAYARYRGGPDNDFGRMRRQQQVMQAAADKAIRMNWFSQGIDLYNQFRGAVDTNMPLTRAPGVANLARLVGPENVSMVSIAGENAEAVTPVITPWGEDVLLPRWDVMSGIIRKALPDQALRDENARVTVVNGTDTARLATRVSAYLGRFSLTPEQIAVGDLPPTLEAPVTETRITVNGDAMDTAKRIADWLELPSSSIVQQAPLPDALQPQVEVLLGRDVRIPDDDRFYRYTPR